MECGACLWSEWEGDGKDVEGLWKERLVVSGVEERGGGYKVECVYW